MSDPTIEIRSSMPKIGAEVFGVERFDTPARTVVISADLNPEEKVLDPV